MPNKKLERWQHNHLFAVGDIEGEKKTNIVVILTILTMTVEIGTDYIYGSMALLADGWHMGTHALALGISVIAYLLTRRYAEDRRFSFGTGKIGALGGFGSAFIL